MYVYHVLMCWCVHVLCECMCMGHAMLIGWPPCCRRPYCRRPCCLPVVWGLGCSCRTNRSGFGSRRVFPRSSGTPCSSPLGSCSLSTACEQNPTPASPEGRLSGCQLTTMAVGVWTSLGNRGS